MIEKWVVTIESVNKEGVYEKFIAERESFQHATRDLLTYTAKRGYMTINYNIEKEWRLF